MITKDEAKSKIEELVKKFSSNLQACKKSTYLEAQLRVDFLNDFFEALGWEVRISSDVPISLRDVITEDKQEVDGRSKSPDYAFRIESKRKFFVEAKKPSVDIITHQTSVFQLRRYGWSASDISVSVLTNFEHFAIYDCNLKPKEEDKPKTGLLKLIHFKDYSKEFEYLWDTFSREAVKHGSLSKFDNKKSKKGSSSVDMDFLASLDSWRTMLAKDIADKNNLDEEQLNFLVQQTIDRIIFLRIAEDRNIEDYETLKKAVSKSNAYKELAGLFRKADKKYNSGLFNQKLDQLSQKATISDEVLQKIINNLYYPKSPYEFSVIPIEILGKAYEQFLGTRIELTSGGNVKFNQKPEVRKAGGVYYTPRYVSEYIVENSVGVVISGKTPEEIESIKICDPASGSGSFLIYVYEYLLNYHKEYYAKKYQVGSKKYQEYFYTNGELKSDIKKKILTNNIYGVDIDASAVEVTKLSLLLKCMEGETKGSSQMSLDFEEALLPTLENNVKCGNSLIDYDIFEDRLSSQTDLNEDKKLLRRINPFNWKKAFPSVFNEGGFNIIVGNPPWGASFSEIELEYLRENHSEVVSRMIDSYIYFIKKAVDLVRTDGYVGYIIPSTLLNQVDAGPTRNFLLAKDICKLINLGQGVFGEKVLNTSTIIILRNQDKQGKEIIIGDLSSVESDKKDTALLSIRPTDGNEWWSTVSKEPGNTFFVQSLGEVEILNKVRKRCGQLIDCINGSIQRGVSPDVVGAHVVSKEDAAKFDLEQTLLRSSISGKQIKKYQPWKSDQFIIYATKSTAIKKFGRCFKYISKFKDENTCKEAKENKHPWWALHRPRDPEIFKSPKIIGLTTTKKIELVYDEKDSLFVTDAMYVFSVKPDINPKLLMGVMQSKAFLYFYRLSNLGEARVIPQIKATKLDKVPVPKIGQQNQELEKLIDNLVALNKGKNPDKKMASHLEERIDRLVYLLYGLEEDEIQRIEEAYGK